jgi:hypothetical protein
MGPRLFCILFDVMRNCRTEGGGVLPCRLALHGDCRCGVCDSSCLVVHYTGGCVPHRVKKKEDVMRGLRFHIGVDEDSMLLGCDALCVGK